MEGAHRSVGEGVRPRRPGTTLTVKGGPSRVAHTDSQGNDGRILPKALQLVTDDPTETAFALLVAEGAKISDAGNQVGISAATAYRWMKRAGVKALVEQAQQEVRERFLRRLFYLGDQAIDTLELAMRNPDMSPTQRQAADSVLDRIGVDKRAIVKHLESLGGDVVVQVNINVPVNAQVVDEQAERRRRREERQRRMEDDAIDADFEVVADDTGVQG